MKSVALIDMDGVLYDSMKYHTLAWQQMMAENGIITSREEFYLYEGMTGAATIRLIFQREFGRDATQEEIQWLYARKTEIFRSQGAKEMMPGAPEVLAVLADYNVRRVLVTGSGQQSLITSIEHDYPGAFASGDVVTAADVTHGKPHPEPYLRGLDKAGADASDAIVIENAPLGVKAGKAAGCYTVAVTTGPIPIIEFEKAGADIILPSMRDLAELLPEIIREGGEA